LIFHLLAKILSRNINLKNKQGAKPYLN